MLLGDQRPRLFVAPADIASTETGREAVELASSVGITADPWEAWLVEQTLAERDDGQWSAFRTAWLVSRQNGKGEGLLILELAALYLLAEKCLHSAHLFPTSREAFRRILAVIDGNDGLRRRVKKVSRSHGEEGIELRHGPELRFMARTGGSGRGFTADRLILDEAQALGDDPYEAVLPTLSARPRPQVNLALTAPDFEIADCAVVARMRRRALAGETRRDLWAEWSAVLHGEECERGCREHEEVDDPRTWARHNPGFGYRLSEETIREELAGMSLQGFARERLGVGNYPADGRAWQIISEAQWATLEDRHSRISGAKVFAADVSPDSSWSSIGVAGRRSDGMSHVEVVDHHPKTAWVVPRLIELQQRYRPLTVVVDSTGPAGALIGPLLVAGFTQLAPTTQASRDAKVLLVPYAREVGAAYAQFVEVAVDSKTLRQLGQPELNAALAGAAKRPVAGAWKWSRQDPGVDITPLVACTNALWGLLMRERVPVREVSKVASYIQVGGG